MSEEAQHEASKHSAPLAAEPAPAPAGTPPPPPQSTDASTAVSQTNIPQMTASCQPAADSGKWCCEVCTYENFPLSRKCTMCRSARPGAGEDILRLQDGARALPPHHASAIDAGVEQVSERLKPLRISSPPAPAAAPAAAGASADLKWPCPTCTYENWPKSLKCAMCGAPAPTPSQKSAGECEVTTVSGSNSVSDIEAAARRNKRRNNNNPDLLWLQACLGVVEGCGRAVEAYLSAGGDPARALTASEVALLNRASAFDAGHTLVHLAIRFQRQDILATLLARISGGGPGLKRSPSYIAPDIAAAIRRHMAASIRHKKGNFPARYINEFTTFSLPAEIEELPAAIQEQLFSELLDREAQQTLEQTPLINWSLELTLRLGSRLYALWNRSAGDCLLDAVSQAALGVFDRNRVLRAALAETLTGCSRLFYPHYTAWEHRSAAALQYACSDSWLHTEWTRLLAAAAQPGTPGSQLHVFALAHVMRRPIIVYGINTINSFRGEPLGYARFQGVYLPLLWDVEFCSKSPLCLGYTRGHFSALVPMEPYSHTHTYICREQQAESSDMTFLPLTDADGKLLPVHFLTADEMGSSEGSEATESILRRWLAVVVTRGGLLACRQTHARPLLVNQMLEEWLNHYRRIAQQTRGPFPPRLQAAEFSSDPDTDDE